MPEYTKFNAEMWDAWSSAGNPWTIPLSHEAFLASKHGPLRVFLTPEKSVPESWYAGLGKRVLGLASGGGQQSALLTAHGYDVTIMDVSSRQLAADRMVAEREGYPVSLVKADMTVPFPFEDESFDWIVNPVSNCYIEDLSLMWQEAYRVLRPGGVLMTGFTNPLVYMFADEALEEGSELPLVCQQPLPYNQRELEKQGALVSIDGGYQFSHTLEQQLRGQMQAGFLIKDLYEDNEQGSRLGKLTSIYLADLALKPL